MVTYHPDLSSISNIFRTHLPTLLVSNKMKLAVPSSPLVANRWEKNLKDLLVRAKLKPQQQKQQQHKGSLQCGRAHCRTCTHIKTGTCTKFCSGVIKETFYAQVTATCKTSNVVYLIECKNSQKEYVGKWRTLFIYEWTATNQITIESYPTNQ